MKRKLTRSGLSLLFLILFVFTSVSLPAFADESDSLLYKPSFDDEGLETSINEDGKEEYAFTAELSLTSFKDTDMPFTFAASPVETSSYYAQLSNGAKACYNKIKATSIDTIISAKKKLVGSDMYNTVEFSADSITGTVISGSIRNNYFTADSNGAAIEKRIYTDFATAWLAISYDYPEYLWLRNISYGFDIEAIPGNKNAVKVTSVVFGFKLLYNGQEKQMYNEMNTAVDKIVNSVTKNSDDRYTKLLAVYNYIKENNVYSEDTSNSLSHTPYSALIIGDNHDPVCDGYSGALKMLCRKLNIPCQEIISTTYNPGHMWNNVQMDDGKWYNTDLTWETPSKGENKYFLLGTKSKINGSVEFNSEPNHIEANIFDTINKSKLNPFTFKYPVKNTEKYTYLGYAQFPDVTSEMWHYNYVLTSSERKLFAGDSYGLFNPQKSITRAEFANVLSRMYGASLNANAPVYFSDVIKGEWYVPAVAWAYENGIMVGGNGYFRPNDPISREEICVAFARFDSIEDYDIPDDLFLDDASISDWAISSVYYCKDIGLVSGYEGNFKPQDNTTRAQAATIFVRYTD